MQLLHDELSVPDTAGIMNSWIVTVLNFASRTNPYEFDSSELYLLANNTLF